MISITGKPDKFSLAGEKQVFTILSDNYLLSPGTKAALIISFKNEIYDGSFTLAWGSKSLVFHIRETLLNDGLEIPAYTSNFTLSQWVDVIVSYFNSNFDLFNDFTITSATLLNEHTVMFLARNTGSNYSLTFTIAESIDPGDLDELSNSAGTDRTLKENFKVLIQALIQNTLNSNVDYGINIAMYHDVNDQGITYYIPNDLVKPELKSVFFRQWISSIPVRKNDYLLRRYYLRITEIFGNPAVSQKVVSSEIFSLINGSIPNWQLNQFSEITFQDWLNDGLKFMTFSPETKKILPDQFEKLFFIYRTLFTIPDDYRILLRVKLYFDDDTFVTIDQGTGVRNLITGEVLEIDCGYGQLGMDAIMSSYPEKTLQKYAVWLVGKSVANVETVLSEVKTFEVDFENHEFKRQFIFRNSIGGFDTIYCIGRSDFENEYSKDTLNFEQPLIPTETAISKKDHNISVNLYGNHTTGYFNKEHFDWIQDFFYSDQIYEIEGTLFKPCRITSSNIKLDDENEMMLSISFQTEYIKEYGEIVTAEETEGEFTNEFNEEFV